MSTIRVLVIDESEAGRRTVASALGAEGWLIQGAASAEEALKRLLGERWDLVVANYSTSAARGPLFELLKELAMAEGRVRVLFLVPTVIADCTRPHLDWHQVPYAITPIRLTDFFERVSELLLEAGALRQPIRRIREGAPLARRRAARRTSSGHGRAMFAPRDAYFNYDNYDEDDLRAFEEEEKRKKQEQEKTEEGW